MAEVAGSHSSRHLGDDPGSRLGTASAPYIPRMVLPSWLRVASAGGLVVIWDRLSLSQRATEDSIMRTLAIDITANDLIYEMASEGTVD